MDTPPQGCGPLPKGLGLQVLFGSGHAAVVSYPEGITLNTRTRNFLFMLVVLGLSVNTGVLLLG